MAEGGGSTRRRLTEDEWLARIAASAVAVDHALDGIAFVDVRNGALLGANRSLRSLLGDDLPTTVDELIERGNLARPDVEDAREQVRRAEAPACAWNRSCRYHRSDGVTVDLDLWFAVIHRFLTPGRVLQVVAREAGAVPTPAPYAVPAHAPSTLTEVYDIDSTIRSQDPRFVDYGLDPRARLGMSTLVLVHPEDQQAAGVVLDRLWRGIEHEGEYTIRVIVPHGGWAPISAHVLRMVGDGDDAVYAQIRPGTMQRQEIPSALLTDRELQVVHALFNGWRVPALAERDGVSTKTIRNQLSTIYKKLDVEGQADLLVRYDAPLSAKSPRYGAVLEPTWAEGAAGSDRPTD